MFHSRREQGEQTREMRPRRKRLQWLGSSKFLGILQKSPGYLGLTWDSVLGKSQSPGTGTFATWGFCRNPQVTWDSAGTRFWESPSHLGLGILPAGDFAPGTGDFAAWGFCQIHLGILPEPPGDLLEPPRTFAKPAGTFATTSWDFCKVSWDFYKASWDFCTASWDFCLGNWDFCSWAFQCSLQLGR